MIIEQLVMFLGCLTLVVLAIALFILICVLTKQARVYYINAKCEVELFFEFLQWKADTRDGESK
jgi:hypothetical protein